MAYQLTTAKVWDGAQWVPAVGGLEPVTSGGDHEDPVNGYYYNVFTQNGTLTVSREVNCEVLMVAGGGGGGYAPNDSAGGGGAGGLILTTMTLSAGSYSVGIGSGGIGSSSTSAKGANGGDTTFNGLTAKGGGGGGSQDTRSGNAGGSGGGGSENGGNNGVGGLANGAYWSTYGTAPYNGWGEQGHHGGSANVGNNFAGGGGGAGGPGHAGAGDGDWATDRERVTDVFFGKRGAGGYGLRLDSWGSDVATLTAGSTIFEAVTWPGISANYTGYWIAGGGGGGDDQNSTSASRGGIGGGGNGAGRDSLSVATSALANSGGGGGGGSDGNAPTAGADGVCIVRYRI